MKQFFCELLFICVLSSPAAQPVDELTYRTVLYEYFQEDYQAALLTALVAEAQQRQGDDSIRFDLAKGSFAFADGMYGYANNIFESIAEGELEQIDKLRLAFHLSREYHRRQSWPELSTQLAKIELGKTWLGRVKVHPEVEFMRAELAVQQGQFEQAEALYASMSLQDPLRSYGVFNMGVAYRAGGMLSEARSTFEQLAQIPAYSNEAYDLSQRAKLALALIARQQNDTHQAESVLQALPGEGRYQDVAMAAYGGLAMDNQDYELAARIWMTLQDEEYWTPSTATARLGFPLSLEKLAASSGRATTGMALLQYKEAEASFVTRLGDLTRLSSEAEDPAWVHGLLQVFAQEQGDEAQMQALMDRWREQLGHTDWLEWLATDQVHQVLIQWRTLNEMQDWLGNLPGHLEALQGVAQEQRRRGEEAKRLLVDEGLLEKRELLVVQTQRMQDLIVAAQQAQIKRALDWMYPLATAQERNLLTDFDRMRGLLGHMSESDQAKWSARINRLEGVIFYNIVEQRSERLQNLRNQHAQLRMLLADLDERVRRVEVAESNFVAGVGTDFYVFEDRAESITAMVSSARESRELLLANEIRGRMQQEMQQVQQYLLVTRIAIARATDQLALAGDVGRRQ